MERGRPATIRTISQQNLPTELRLRKLSHAKYNLLSL
jgi:hypothetical protein